jgi:hypothetical protein
MSRYIDEIEWKPVFGYEGLYEVSNIGEIRHTKGNIKKPTIKKDKHTNYKQVSLWKDGKNKSFLVHRLVAQAFIPNPNNYPIINHKDEDGTNNCVVNLEWCNHSYNTKYNKFPEKVKPIPTKIVKESQRAKTSASVKKYRREHAKLKFEYEGEMLSIPEIAENMSIKPSTLWMRYLRTGSIYLGAKMDGRREE